MAVAAASNAVGHSGFVPLGPLAGVWIVKGNLPAATLGVLPLTDPYVALVVAGHRPRTGNTGDCQGWIVLAFYLLVGGRVILCLGPVNMVTDTAGWLRRRLGIRVVCICRGVRVTGSGDDADRLGSDVWCCGIDQSGVDAAPWADLRYGLAWSVVLVFV